MPIRNDIHGAVSTVEPATYQGSPGLTEYDRSWKLTDAWPVRQASKSGRRYCGGRWDTGSELLALDIGLRLAGNMYPDQMGWMQSYLKGGAAYAVAGGADPYTHTSKKSAPTQAHPDAFAMMLWHDGATTFWEYLGLQFDNFTITIPEDPTAALTFEADVLGCGKRNEITSGYTPPACSEETAYRAGDVTLALSTFSGTPITIDPVGATLTWSNGLDPNPRRRSGLFVSSYREFGSEHPMVSITLPLIGEPGDVIDDHLETNTELALTATFTNPTTDREHIETYPDLEIVSVEAGYSTFNDKYTHNVTLRGLLDPTSALTKANAPGYSSTKTGTATYRRTP